MASFFYVIVSAAAVEKLGLKGLRQRVGDDRYLLNQKDFSTQPGATLWERVTPFGGVLVSEAEASAILGGQMEVPALPEVETTEVQPKETTEDEPMEETAETHQEDPADSGQLPAEDN